MVSTWESRAAEVAGPVEEKFATSSGRWLGWIGVGIGAAMVILDPLTADGVNVSIIFLGVAVAAFSWIVLVRPRASAHRHALLLQNMLRDVAIPWPRIERCQVGQTLVVSTTEAERFHGLGVTRSARTQIRETYGTTSLFFNLGGGRATGQRVEQSQGPSIAKGEWDGGSYTSYIESRIAGLASRGERGGDPERSSDPVVAWAPIPVALLVVALVCVLAAFVV